MTQLVKYLFASMKTQVQSHGKKTKEVVHSYNMVLEREAQVAPWGLLVSQPTQFRQAPGL